MSEPWRHCSRCRNPIAHRATYWTCSVSTCNRKRAPMVFCTMDCWDAHVPLARHREAWAQEHTAPTPEEAAAEKAGEGKRRRPVAPEARRRVVPGRRRDPGLPRDVLIVASKLKDYIRAASGMNTSAAVMERDF